MSKVAIDLRAFLTKNHVDHRKADALSQSIAGKLARRESMSTAEIALIEAFEAASGDGARTTWPTKWKGFSLDGKSDDATAAPRPSPVPIPYPTISAKVRDLADAVPMPGFGTTAGGNPNV